MKTAKWQIFSIIIVLMFFLLSSPASAEIKVYINGGIVQFDVPPVQVGGRTLVPLRGIFEGLGAEVKWEAASRTITAIRSNNEVKLVLGDRNAYINGELSRLDVPPSSIMGRTMVPLRFVGEAFGADVRWVGSLNSIYINDDGRPATQQPTAPPSSPSTDEVRTITGTVDSVNYSGSSPNVKISVNNAIYTFYVDNAKTIVRTIDIDKGLASQTSLSRIYPGDHVTITTAPGSYQAGLVEARIRNVEGKISAYGANRVILEDGGIVTLNPNARIFYNQNKVSTAHIASGQQGVFRINPESNEAWRVNLSSVSSQQPHQTGAVIQRFWHNASSALNPGDVVSFILEGSPGGSAYFTIAGVVERQSMREVRSGYYEGSYTVKRNDRNVRTFPMGRIVLNNGSEAELRTSNILEIINHYSSATDTSLQVPVISSPKPNEKVDMPFKIVGMVRPNTQVVIRVEQSADMGLLSAELGVLQERVQSDNQGRFELSVSFLLRPPGAKYLIRVHQEDAEGKTSPAASITVNQR